MKTGSSAAWRSQLNLLTSASWLYVPWLVAVRLLRKIFDSVGHFARRFAIEYCMEEEYSVIGYLSIPHPFWRSLSMRVLLKKRCRILHAGSLGVSPR